VPSLDDVVAVVNLLDQVQTSHPAAAKKISIYKTTNILSGIKIMAYTMREPG
jgi:hypothetical protein